MGFVSQFGAVRGATAAPWTRLRHSFCTVLVVPVPRRQGGRGVAHVQRSFTTAATLEGARPETPGKKIVVLGGGFGGLYTALRLSQYPFATRAKPEITLVDQNDRFIFLPFLYELLSGEVEPWEVAPRFEALLGSGHSDRPRFVQGRVQSIDVSQKRVLLSESSLEYDRLVIALGSVARTDPIPGAGSALSFKSLADAERLKERIRDLGASADAKSTVVVIGGGYSGAELACKIADKLKGKASVVLVERGGTVLKNSSDFNREKTLQALAKREVRVLTSVMVNRVDTDSVSLTLSTGAQEIIRSHCVILTAGSEVSPVVQTLPLPRNDRGQLLVSGTLQVTPEIFALGDCAAMQGGREAPATAQAAIQQADYTAWNVWASCTGRQYLPFRYQDLGEMVGLGINDATFSSPLMPFGIPGLAGPAASLVRRLVYLYRLPSPVHQLDVARSWLAKGATFAAEALDAMRKEYEKKNAGPK